MAQVNCGQTKELYNNGKGRHKDGRADTQPTQPTQDAGHSKL